MRWIRCSKNKWYILSRNYEYIYLYLGGKCGVCGDSYTGPRYHEIGGKYATNTIVRNYVSGALIDIKILVKYQKQTMI